MFISVHMSFFKLLCSELSKCCSHASLAVASLASIFEFVFNNCASMTQFGIYATGKFGKIHIFGKGRLDSFIHKNMCFVLKVT